MLGGSSAPHFKSAACGEHRRRIFLHNSKHAEFAAKRLKINA